MRSALSSEFNHRRARVWHLQSDATLCALARSGEQRAFEELSRRHRRAVAAFVFHMLGGRHRREDAEDVVQEAFANAFARIRKQGVDGSFRALLFTIARNRAIDLMRRERVRLVPLELDNGEQRESLPAVAGAAAAVAEANEEFSWLVDAIADLPERQRSALLLRELGGLSHDQIAHELGTTSASARQLITRGRSGVRRAAARDERAGRLVGARPKLREQLVASAALLPSATIGAGAVAGSAAGGWAVGAKLVALVVALAAVAGAPGVVSNGSARGESQSPGLAAASARAGGSATPAAQRVRPGGDSTDARRKAALGNSHVGRAGPAGPPRRQAGAEHHPAAEGNAPRPGTGSRPLSGQQLGQQLPKAPSAGPLDPVVELPGKVVGDLTDGLSGKQSLPQSVGDVLSDTTDGLGKTVDGLVPKSGD